MPLDNPKSGINFAAEFQSSALPWVTSSVAPTSGSPHQFRFQHVTRFITVSNRDPSLSLSISFTRAGMVSTGKKYMIGPNKVESFELRVKELWIQGEGAGVPYSLMAGLTNVQSRNMPVLTGTLPDGSSGWDGVG